MKKRWPILLLCMALTAGCAARPGGPNPAPAEDTAPETDVPAPAEDPGTPEPANFFETLPGSFLLASGAGAWGVELTVEADGSFTGVYHDCEMGSIGEGYPNGTRYYCAFSGKFTQPEQVDETAWAMEIEAMELEHPADEAEEIIDEIRYVYTGPYGLENAEELLIYLPATMVEGLAKGVLRAVQGPRGDEPMKDGTLGVYVIYNPAEDLGFVEYTM